MKIHGLVSHPGIGILRPPVIPNPLPPILY